MAKSHQRRGSHAALPLPPPPALDLEEDKATKNMRSSLDNLYSCLLCPLCNKLYNNPVTLPACAHSFCQACINDYSCNNYECPVCSLPITLRGSRAGKFDKTNPQIETVVSSFGNICNALNVAPRHWWKEPVSQEDQLPEVLQTGRDEAYSFIMPRDDDNNNDEDEDKTNNDNMVEEEEVMDFQPDDAEEEVMDFQPDDHEGTKDDEEVQQETYPVVNDAAMQADDDDATAPFPAVASPSASSIQSKRSCSLPSQSPDCSVIPFVASQMTTIDEQQNANVMTESHNKENEGRARHDDKHELKTPKISNLEDSYDNDDDMLDDTVHIFVATQLSSSDRKLLKNLERNHDSMQVVDTLSNTTTSNSSSVCLCGNAEMETGDGWLVGLTYQYLEAMARGVPIMYTSSYLKEYDTTNNDSKNRVIGIGSSSDWMGPQRAVAARKAGKSKLLFEGCTLLLVGDFDTLPKRGGGEAQEKIYSKERLATLLRLCGADVFASVSELDDHQNSKVAYLIRPTPHSRDWRAARKEVDDSKATIICAKWLLESLADYRCKDWNLYTQANFK